MDSLVRPGLAVQIPELSLPVIPITSTARIKASGFLVVTPKNRSVS